MTGCCFVVGGVDCSAAGDTDCSVAGGTVGFGAGGTGYSANGAAEHSVAGGPGAEDTENFVAGVVVTFVNFHPSPPHVLNFLHIWGSAVPMNNSLQLVWG